MNSKESRVRYYACECMYNVAKVSKGELLRFFNSLFETLCMLSADTEYSVRNGRDILDRLIKEIVFELAATYISPHGGESRTENTKAFSLDLFVPLLRRHVYSHNPLERLYVMSWMDVLDSVPGLGFFQYLPDFLDGLIRYLGDAKQPVRASARLLLSKFFHEVQQMSHDNNGKDRGNGTDKAVAIPENPMGGRDRLVTDMDNVDSKLEHQHQQEISWSSIQYSRIIEILIPHLSSPKEDIQRTALQWTIEFIAITKNIIIQYTPRIIVAVLPLLEHPVPTISAFANETNRNLQKIVVEAPAISDPVNNSNDWTTLPSESKDEHLDNSSNGGLVGTLNSQRRTLRFGKRPGALQSGLFDYHQTVINLRLQLLSEQKLTRIASIEWFLLLYRKTPEKMKMFTEGTLSVLLKTLRDSSEQVVRRDLELIAEICSHVDEANFYKIFKNLLYCFEANRRLLESRGTLVIRELCALLGSEKIYCTIAKILEDEVNLEFASLLVQNLMIIMITSEELKTLRHQLRSLDTKDGQRLFLTLYRSWSHNVIAAISLALVAEAYEHAANMLQIFADIEVTVPMLIQLDQLVQLLESPVFTYLRLQLLEPDKYPHLLKCLYGIFMLLPQSCAFSTLRSRLNSASSLGFLHAMPKRYPKPHHVSPNTSTHRVSSRWIGSSSSPSKHLEEENRIKFDDLLQHLRLVQQKHEQYSRSQSMCSESQ
ncbi:vacuolar protein 14 C-terminal Fig4p binding-domain-containing protein [Dichotomocladium elegans]|nr:vacuolar protein 14 C-terminal Fig4p binding-domain-containing protein [Dichotomocladium elegans]